MKYHALLRLRHAVICLFVLAGLTAVFSANAQVRAPGNGKPLPDSAQKAPPFQQGSGGGGGGGGEGTLPRIVHGTFSNAGDYDDFTVTLASPGAGPNVVDLGLVTVTPGSKTVTGPGLASKVQQHQYIMIPASPTTELFPFYQVTRLNAPDAIEITPVNPAGILMPFNDTRGYTGPGGEQPASKNMYVVPVYTVTFKQPFAYAPTIVVSSRGGPATPDSAATQSVNIPNVVHGAGPMSNSSFEVLVYQYPFSPYNQPTGTIDFIAIGN